MAAKKEMSKWSKLIMVMVLGLSLALVGVGCSSNTEPAADEPESASSAAPERETTPEPEPSEPVSHEGEDWRTFMDDYEAWVDQYVAIVDRYVADPTDSSIMSDLNELTAAQAEFEARANAVTETISEADIPEFEERMMGVLDKLTAAINKLS